MSKDGINSKDFIIGTLIGGIIGATTALFLAPKSGRELREDLNQQAHVVKDKTSKLTNDAYEKGSQFISLAKEKTNSASQTISDQSSQLINKVKELGKSPKEDHDEVVEVVAEEVGTDMEEQVENHVEGQQEEEKEEEVVKSYT
ncbi:YtxH domain-containing protein [Bacillus sp. FJAT-47783]|uniref:YtxH domain-containing protein n=1 Tax=Bacillus sp. FJAT-47783 TaxID=2922712 RepID=UPI001FAE0E3C|nr:YtxH domain-containing protein [Bacillus sp. FJAT-47783]